LRKDLLNLLEQLAAVYRQQNDLSLENLALCFVVCDLLEAAHLRILFRCAAENARFYFDHAPPLFYYLLAVNI
jgi:hypothetical protein